MSLVFLKNDDQSRDDDPASTDSHLLPWRWTNYFTNPIRIPRNAQVGYIKSSFQQPLTGWVDTTNFFIVQGLTELNPTIPLFLEGGNVTDWLGIFGEMGRLCNQYGVDGNFNNSYQTTDTYEGIFQLQYGQAGTPPLFLDGLEGWNFLLTNDNKINLRVLQRQGEDIGNQMYNSGGYNAAAGLNTLQLTQVDYAIETIDSPYYTASAGVLGSGFPNPASRDNPMAGASPVAPGFAQFYDIGWTSIRCQDSSYGIGSGNPDVYPAFNQQITGALKGHYCCSYSATPIKQYVGVFSTTSLGVGHATEPNGYVVKTFRNWPQAFANTDYPNPNGVVANAGLYAGGFDSFGIQSIELIENMPNNTGISDSQERYIEQVDLNSASSATIAAGSSVPRYFFGCDIEVRGGLGLQYPVLSVKILDPAAPIGNTQYIEVASLDLTAAAAAALFSLNTTLPVNAGFNPGMLAVRFRWTSPYCMACEYCYRYRTDVDEPFAPGIAGGNPGIQWVLLYDMNSDDTTTREQYVMPGYLGDLTLIEYPAGNGVDTFRKGWFDYRKGYRLEENQALGLDLNMQPLQATSYYEGLSLNDYRCGRIDPANLAGGTLPINLTGVVPEAFHADGYSEKQLTLVCNPITNVGDLGEVQTAGGDNYFLANNPDTHIGDVMGLEGAPIVLNNDILTLGTPYVAYGLNGAHSLHLSERVNSLHIQIENLAIQSQNGVKSTQNKTIAVVSTQDAFMNLDPLNSNNIYNDTAPVVNWIDLNNYNEMMLQQLQVKITYDDNTEAVSLINRSDVTIMFRQKPNTSSVLPDNIQNLGMKV